MTTKNLFANRATAKLSVDLASSDTAITLVAGGGAWFPEPGANEFFRMVVQKGSGASDQREYMVCTSRLGDVLTVTRAQEGTPAANFTIGDEASLVVTAVSFDGLVQKVGQTLQSALEVEADPVTPLGIATKQFVEDTALDEVPNDGKTYGRQFGLWDMLGDAAQLPVPIPIGAGGTGGISLSEAQLNLVIARTSIDDLAPANPRYGDRWIKPSNMTELVWVPNQGGSGGAGVWINPMDSQSEAYPIPITKGGTGATDAPTALTNLGGTTVGKALFTTASAAAARATLGSTVVGDAVFIAATQAAGRTALGILDYTTTAFKLFDGTVAAPGLAWNSEPGLGWYRSAASVIRMAAQGGNPAVFDFSAAANTVIGLNPRAAGSAGISLANQPFGVPNVNILSSSINATTATIQIINAGTAGAIPLYINNQAPINFLTSTVTMQSPLATSGIGLFMGARGAGTDAIIWGQRDSSTRWSVQMPSTDAETGSNAGSSWVLNRYNDAGTYTGSPITVRRSDGRVLMPLVTIPDQGSITFDRSSGHSNQIFSLFGGVLQWNTVLGGGGSGEWSINRYDGSGTYTGTPIFILPNGEFRIEAQNFKLMGLSAVFPAGGVLVRDGATGQVGFSSSSARYKKNIETLEDAGFLYDLRPVTFETSIAGYDNLGRLYGLIAEEVDEVAPAFVYRNKKGEPDGVHYMNLVAPIIAEMKKLNARVAQLENC